MVDAKIKSKVKSQTEPILDSDKLAKSGKRSARSIAEAKIIEDKRSNTRANDVDKDNKKTVKSNPPRSRIERAGKKYRAAAKKIDSKKAYELTEAVKLAIVSNPSKVDSTLELHMNLNVDPKQAEQNVRGNVILPSGTVKNVRVVVIADDKNAKSIEIAGAKLISPDEIFKKLDKEIIDFDVLITTPELMSKLSKYARLLGPKGLMPNPKSGTVTKNPAQAVSEANAGKIEYRVDSYGIIHLSIGKLSLGENKLVANADELIKVVKANRPPGIKGAYIKSIVLATTMGPGIRLQI